MNHDNENPIAQPVSVAVYWLLGILVCSYTGYHTWQTLNLVSSPIMAWVGLGLFEGGTLGWAMFYSYGARGAQRAIAVGASLIDLALCITCAVLHIMLVQQLTAAPEWASGAVPWVLGLSVAINGVMMWMAHMADPKARRRAHMQTIRDQIESEALRQAGEMATQDAPELGRMMARRLHAGVASSMLADTGVSDAEGRTADGRRAAPSPTRQTARPRTLDDVMDTDPDAPSPTPRRNGADVAGFTQAPPRE